MKHRNKGGLLPFGLSSLYTISYRLTFVFTLKWLLA